MRPTAQTLLQRVAAAHGLPLARILARDRRRPVVRARQDACWLLRHSATLGGQRRSLPYIARLLGFADHTSVSYALGQVEKRRSLNPGCERRLDQLLGQQLPPEGKAA